MTETTSAAIFAFLGVLATLKLLNPIAEKIGLLDKPNSRKQHIGQIPLTGGIAIYLSLWATSILIPSIPSEVVWLMGSGALLVVIGMIDDYRPLGVLIRLGTQVLAALIMMLGAELQVHTLLPGTALFEDLPPWISIPLTVIAVVGLINAFNMIDGIDGLAGCVAVIACLGLVVGQAFLGFFQATGFILIFCCAVIGYLCVNLTVTSRRKVFLGDAGSLLIGFVVAWTLIFLSQSDRPSLPPTLVIWAVALPVWDTLAVSTRRIRKGLSPFHADRTHLHHICLRAGMTKQQALGVLALLALVTFTLGIMIEIFVGSLASLNAFCAATLAMLIGQARIWKILVWVRRQKIFTPPS